MKVGGKIVFILLVAVVASAAVTPEPASDRGDKPVRRCSIVFVGDIMQHMPQVRAAATAEGYDFAPQFASIKGLFDKAGCVIANLETTLADNPPFSGYPSFATPAQLARDLHRSGIDAVSIANNHICDRGTNGIASTTRALSDAGVRYVGAAADSLDYDRNNPLLVDMEGFRFAILAYTYGVNGNSVPSGARVNVIDTARMRADLDRLPENTDYTVMLLHWGGEYDRTPSAAQRSLASWCRRAGVDFVIGSHPHVVQPCEVERDSTANVVGATVYSLGNFISNQNDPHTDYGLLVSLTFEQTDTLPVRVSFEADTVRRLRYRRDDGRMMYETVKE